MEAKKRRASSVCLVESDKKRYAEILKRSREDVKCLCMDVRRALPRFCKNGESFDIIFADPPYGLGWGRELPELIASNSDVLADGGILIFEHTDREEPAELDPEEWSREDRVYGGTVLTFYRKVC